MALGKGQSVHTCRNMRKRCSRSAGDRNAGRFFSAHMHGLTPFPRHYYDALNRLLRVNYPDGTYEQVIYGRLNVEWYRDRAARWTHMEHNGRGELIAETDPMGRATQFLRCFCGALVGIHDAKGQHTTFAYDEQTRLTDKLYADGSGLHYIYETNTSRLKSMTDAKNQRTNYSYRLDNSLAALSYSNAAGGPLTPSTPPVTFALETPSIYPRRGSMTDATGTTLYTYVPNGQNGAGRLAAETWTGATGGAYAGLSHKITHSYDEYGRETSHAIAPTGSGANAVAETVLIDRLNRGVTVVNALGTFGYGYVGDTGRVSSVTYPVNSPYNMRVNFDYFPNVSTTAGNGNGDRRVSAIKAYRYYYPGNPAGQQLLSEQDYTYDMAGNIATWGQRADTTASQRTWALGHDGADQLLGATVRNGGTVEKQYRYDYDLAGNRTVEQVDSVVKTAGYGDPTQPANQLNQMQTRVGGGQVIIEGHTNEPAAVTVGGRAAATDALNNYRGVAAVTAGTTNSIAITATDANGTTTAHAQVTVPVAVGQSYVYDPNGNLTSDSVNSYEWDAANRLVAIVYPGTGGGRTEFSYNGVGQRVRELEKNASGVVTADRRLVWEGWAPREQRNASHQVTRRYFRNGVQEVTNSGNTQYTQNYYFVRDHLGSIRDMVDSSGSTQARYSYDPWGRRTRTTGSKDADFGFTGHYYHARSGLHLAFYRAYSADMGRWISRDPIAERGGLNIYDYVANRPGDLFDPTGESFLVPFLIVVAIAAISVASLISGANDMANDIRQRNEGISQGANGDPSGFDQARQSSLNIANESGPNLAWQAGKQAFTSMIPSNEVAVVYNFIPDEKFKECPDTDKDGIPDKDDDDDDNDGILDVNDPNPKMK